MIKALFVAPYPGLAEIAKKISGEQEDIQLDIETGNLEAGVIAGRQAEKDGYDIIISRGGTATMIQQEVSIPVVHIDVTGYDMLRVFTLVRGMEKEVALVGFSNISQGAATLCNILEFDVKMVTIESRKEVKGYLEQLKQEGISVVLGDVVTIQAAEQVGLRGILITSGKEAVAAAFEEAKRLYDLFQKVKQQFAPVTEMFYSLPFPALLVDKQGKIAGENSQYQQQVKQQLTEFPQLVTLAKQVFEHNAAQWTTIHTDRQTFYIQAFPVGSSLAGMVIQPYTNQESDRAITITSNLSRLPIIGSSQQAVRVRGSIHQYKDMNGPLCIFGEPGTGRKTAAQAIHLEKYGQQAAMVVIETSLLPEQKVEIAEITRKLAAIKNGTVLLKDIETLTTAAQLEILQVVNQLPDTFQLLSVTTEHLDELLQQGKFNQQLYQKLTRHSLHLPPLRARKEDIAAFVHYFLADLHASNGNETLGIKKAAVDALERYDWPGNLYQLEQAVSELSLMTNGYYVEQAAAEQLVAGLQSSKPADSLSAMIPVTGTVAEMEKQIIAKVLEEEGNNQSRAAKRLGINRSTLWRKLNQ